MRLESLRSAQEARVALGYRLEQLLRFFRALQTSRVHPWLDIRTLSMNQFLNINKLKKDCKVSRNGKINEKKKKKD